MNETSQHFFNSKPTDLTLGQEAVAMNEHDLGDVIHKSCREGVSKDIGYRDAPAYRA